MTKIIMFIHRRPGISFEQFRSHYEEVHVPLALRKFSLLRRYVRNYCAPVDGQPAPICDCVTELWFDDMDACRRQMAATRDDPDPSLQKDEELFMDRAATRHHIVDERESAMV